jgi:DNA-binding transcriptional LysR family regulator
MVRLRDTEFRKLDLNLLKVFVALVRTGSVTDAGQALNLAQSSVSHALARLRQSLGDPLFVRGVSGMQPTPLALELAEPIADALNNMEVVLFQDRHFDAKRSNRTFNLLLADASEGMVLPHLLSRFAKLAPHVNVFVHHRDSRNYREVLENGQADLAIGQLPYLYIGFYQQLLFSQSLVCVSRPGHSLSRKVMALETYLAADHLVVDTPAVAELHLATALGAAAARRKIRVRICHYFSAIPIIANTDYIAMLPKSVVAEPLRSGLIEQIPYSFEIPPFAMKQFWHARTNHDLACRWLRRTVMDLFVREEIDSNETQKL